MSVQSTISRTVTWTFLEKSQTNVASNESQRPAQPFFHIFIHLTQENSGNRPVKKNKSLYECHLSIVVQEKSYPWSIFLTG